MTRNLKAAPPNSVFSIRSSLRTRFSVCFRISAIRRSRVFFFGLLIGKIERPIAAAVLLDNWRPGETASATYLPGFFNPRYAIVDATRRQLAPGVYDETEHVFCARMSVDDRYLGAVYVKSLTPLPFRPEERVEITRIAAYIAIYRSIRDIRPPESEPKKGKGREPDQRPR